jgi:hypothetical protein
MLCNLCWNHLKYSVFQFLFTVRNIALKVIFERKKTELNERSTSSGRIHQLFKITQK